jgi:hypothetical protein
VDPSARSGNSFSIFLFNTSISEHMFYVKGEIELLWANLAESPEEHINGLFVLFLRKLLFTRRT